MHALIKGYGKDAGINSMISMFWAAASQQSCDPWLERVSSKANIGDGVSRNDMTLAHQMGWVPLQLDLQHVWPNLLKTADDIEFALQDGHEHICAILRPQINRQIQ